MGKGRKTIGELPPAIGGLRPSLNPQPSTPRGLGLHTMLLYKHAWMENCNLWSLNFKKSFFSRFNDAPACNKYWALAWLGQPRVTRVELTWVLSVARIWPQSAMFGELVEHDNAYEVRRRWRNTLCGDRPRYGFGNQMPCIGSSSPNYVRFQHAARHTKNRNGFVPESTMYCSLD